MRIKQILALLGVQIISQFMQAQNSCACMNFAKKFIDVIENDYVERNLLKNNIHYQHAKKEIATQNDSGYNIKCLRKIYNIVKAIKDPHITFRVNQDTSLTNRLFDSLGLERLYANFTKRRFNKNKIEGLWELNNGEYKYVVVRNSKIPTTYNVIMWESYNKRIKPGFLKGTLQKYNKDTFIYLSYLDTGTVTMFALQYANNSFFSVNTGIWEKKKEFTKKNFKPSTDPEFRSLTKNTTYLKLPSFAPYLKVQIDSIINANHANITASDHLIIDIRDNLGGVTGTYENLLKYIYTDTFRIEGTYYFSSPENLRKINSSMAMYPPNSQVAQSYKSLIEKLESNPGQLSLDPGYYKAYDTIFKKPAVISILTNNRTASASELFLITARQSKKVLVFGENTRGSIDRQDAYLIDAGCKNLIITLPTGLRKKEVYLNDIDNVGIPPHIKISNQADWIKYVMEYYKND